MNEGDIEKAGGATATQVRILQGQVAAVASGVSQVRGLAAQSPRSNDLFNPDDPDVAFGQYINPTTGALTNGNGLNSTGYIPVEQGATYVMVGAVASNRRAYYDANKNFVAGVYDFSPAPFTIPSGTGIAYMRLSVPLANWETLRVEKGISQLTYSGFANRPPLDEMNRWMLRQCHNILAGLAFGESGQLVINLGGDSYTHGAARFVTRVASYLASKFGDAGGGWCGFGFLAGGTEPWANGNQPTYLNGNSRPSLYPVRLYGTITSGYYTEGMADLASAILSANGDAVEIDFPASPTVSGIDLHWIGTGAGSIRYTLNGGSSWTSLSVSGTSGTTAVTALSLSGLTQPGTLRIEWVSGTAKLGGVNLKSSANGVRVNKLAATGSTITPWANLSSGAGFTTSYQALGGNVFSYMDGPNDQSGINYTQWATSLISLVNNIKTLVPSGDILIMVPPENARTTNTYAIAGYAKLARNLATSMRFAIRVVRFGDAGNTAEYKSTGSVPLLNADDLHPNDPGGRLIAANFLRMILPW